MEHILQLHADVFKKDSVGDILVSVWLIQTSCGKI
jgi:hypothetical protein